MQGIKQANALLSVVKRECFLSSEKLSLPKPWHLLWIQRVSASPCLQVQQEALQV